MDGAARRGRGRGTAGPAVRAVLRPAVRCGAALLLGAAVAVLPATVLPASAAPATAARCAAVVAPGAPELVDDPQVDAALETLRADGAVPWVRVWASVPDADLEAAVRAAAAGCTGVAGRPSGLAADVVVLAVSLDDRLSGFYYGRTWAAALADTWQDDLGSDVDPLLAAGDVTGAVVAGLEVLDGRVAGTGTTVADAGSVGGGTSDVPEPQGAAGSDVLGDPAGDPAGDPFDGPVVCDGLPPDVDLTDVDCVEGTNGTAGGNHGGTVVGVVVLGAAGVGALFGAAGRRSRNGLRDRAQQAADLAGRALDALGTGLDGVRAVADGLAAGLAGPDADDVRGRVEALAAAVRPAQQQAALAERLHPRTGVGALSSERARAAAADWTRVTGVVDDARAAVAAARGGLDADVAAVAGLQTDLDTAAGEAAVARDRVADAAAAGFTTSAQEALLDEAGTLLAAARADAGRGLALTAARAVARARAATAGAVAQAEGLGARREAVLAAAAATGARADGLRADVAQAQDRFDVLREGHDGSLWTDLAAGLEDAPARLDRALAAVEEAQVAASMRAQRWDDAEAAADRARVEADAVAATAQAVGSRLAAVEEAQRLLPQRCTRALDAAEDAARFVRRHRGDVPVGTAARVDAAEAALRDAAGALAAPRPAWLRLRDAVATAEQDVADARREAGRAVEEAQRERAARRRRNRSSAAVGFGAAGFMAADDTASSFTSFGGSSDAGSGGGSDTMGGGSSSW